MSKRAKFIIFLIAVSLVLIFYLIFTSKIVTLKPTENNAPGASQNKINKVDMVAMENNYRVGIKAIYSEYGQLLKTLDQKNRPTSTSTNHSAPASDEVITGEKISELKNRLLGLTVPPQLLVDAEKLHTQYLLPSFGLISSYLADGDKNDKQKAVAYFEQIKKDYSWLEN